LFTLALGIDGSQQRDKDKGSGDNLLIDLPTIFLFNMLLLLGGLNNEVAGNKI